MPANLTLNFALYFAMSISLWLAMLFVYVKVTPYSEFQLVREGNLSAALSLSGTAIGLALPLGSLAMHAVSAMDMLVWALVALTAQLVLWLLLRMELFKELKSDIVADKRSVGVVLGALSIGLGLLNAACLTY